MTMVTGKYTGTGNAQSVNLSFQPKLVIIASAATKGSPNSRAVSVKSESMSSDDFFELGSNPRWRQSDGIAITASGFDVGTRDIHSKKNETFHYVAYDSNVVVGGYTGDGNPSRAFDLGAVPAAVWVMDKLPNSTAFWAQTADEAEDDNDQLYAEMGWFQDGAGVPLRLSGNGFSVHKTGVPSLNEDGETYYYVALMAGETGKATSPGVVSLSSTPKAVFAFTAKGAGGGFKLDTMAGADFGRCAAKYTYDDSGDGVTIGNNEFTLGSLYSDLTSAYPCYWTACE